MYDVVFIGSGHASWHGALALAQAGKKVAIVEEELTGGTCTNYGCDAKIALDGPFEYFSGLENYKGVCVDEMPRIDWTRLMAYKKRETNNLYLGLEQMFPAVGIDFIRGHGTIAAAHTVRVGEKYLETEYIVIATGQRSARGIFRARIICTEAGTSLTLRRCRSGSYSSVRGSYPWSSLPWQSGWEAPSPSSPMETVPCVNIRKSMSPSLSKKWRRTASALCGTKPFAA